MKRVYLFNYFAWLMLAGQSLDAAQLAADTGVNPILDQSAAQPAVPSSSGWNIDINPCDMTAYGETLYIDADLDDEIEFVDFDEQYKRARMAFLFGNYEFAYRIWEPLAHQGHSKAQATIAWMYHTGKGVTKNVNTALTWYRLAAKQDHVIALNNLGVFYEQGIAVGKNYKRAAAYYIKAAELGYPYAQYNLGVLYRSGEGVKKNENKAIYWLQLASLQGVKQASAELEQLGEKSLTHKNEFKNNPPAKKYHQATVKEGVTGSKGEPAKNHYILTSRWISAQDPDWYTVQLAGSDDLKALILLANKVPKNNEVAFYEMKKGGKNWYNLLYGRFNGKNVAQNEIDKLPESFKKWSPWIRKFSDVQKLIKTTNTRK